VTVRIDSKTPMARAAKTDARDEIGSKPRRSSVMPITEIRHKPFRIAQ